MNKIRIVNDKIDFMEIDDSIEISFKEKNDNYLVNVIKIIIHKNTELDIDYKILEDSKLDLFINVKREANAKIYEHANGEHLKVQYKYYLEENSLCDIYKTSNLKGTKEYTIINLNGKSSNVKRVIKTVSTRNEQYDMMVYHNAKETVSNLINQGVNLDNGSLTFNVSSFVPKDNAGCVVDQNNRIINLTQNECMIKPNMYIDCFDVTANHSAFVGAFKDMELFYLQSRGIPKEVALKLLINGFLISNLPLAMQDDFKDVSEKYWR